MNLKFKAVAKTNPLKPTDPPKYYPSPIYNGTYSLDELSKHISNMSTISEIDIAGVLRAFVKVFPELLQQGNRIDLEGVGMFSLGFETTASEKAEDVTAKNVSRVKLKFSAEHKLKQAVERTQVTKG
ncbi:MAG: HU family DNA-binding protein [Bacteroidales bacterium]|nr:HU family DNA-binding protein [Bacteroidales bacterium]